MTFSKKKKSAWNPPKHGAVTSMNCQTQLSDSPILENKNLNPLQEIQNNKKEVYKYLYYV